MDDYDSPLGRMFEYLSSYEQESKNQKSVRATWANVLKADPHTVAIDLATVTGRLLPDVREQVEMSRNAFVGRTWASLGREWSAPFLHENVPLDNSPTELPVGNLDTLGLLYTAELAAGVSEGPLPDETQIDDWIVLLDELREQVEGDKSLDGQFRADLVRRIDGLISALQSYERHGPAGVQAAVREVLGELVLHQAQAPKEKRYPTVAKAVGVIMTIAAGVVAYPDFREGALQISSDSSHVIETVVGEWKEEQLAQLPSADALKQADDGEQDEPPAA